jgi:hypothetical protein
VSMQSRYPDLYTRRLHNYATEDLLLVLVYMVAVQGLPIRVQFTVLAARCRVRETTQDQRAEMRLSIGAASSGEVGVNTANRTIPLHPIAFHSGSSILSIISHLQVVLSSRASLHLVEKHINPLGRTSPQAFSRSRVVSEAGKLFPKRIDGTEGRSFRLCSLH